MERRETYDFSDEELETLERALAMYAGYTREMEVAMLVGDESDADKVSKNHNRAMKMHRDIYNEVNEKPFGKARDEMSMRLERPADINDFSPFDWHEYVSEKYGDK